MNLKELDGLFKSGGPAYPASGEIDGGGTWGSLGMTLLDWFAGQAMQGLVHNILIDQHWEDVLLKQGLTSDEFPAYLAYLSYVVGRAMLREREKPTATESHP